MKERKGGPRRLRTYSDVKSSVDSTRHKRPASRITRTEEGIKQELTDHFGDVISLTPKEIAQMEEEERQKVESYKINLMRSRLKSFQAKERGDVKASIVQESRKELGKIHEPVGRTAEPVGRTVGRGVEPKSERARKWKAGDIKVVDLDWGY